MSNRLLKEVRRLENLRGPGRAILMVLADHADEKGVCWPSIATIARETGFCETTVKKYLRKLRDADGFVRWQQRCDSKGDQSSNRYYLTLHTPSPDASPWDARRPGGGRETTEGGARGDYEAPRKPHISTKEAGESPYGVRKRYVEELED